MIFADGDQDVLLQLDLEKHEKNMMHIIIITSDPSVDLFSHEIKKARELGGALWTQAKKMVS